MPIQLPGNLKPAQKVFSSSFTYLEPPFPYLHLSWHNGNKLNSKIEKAKHYGGFQRGESDITADLAKMNLTTLPSYFSEPSEWFSEGEDERSYTARSSQFLYAAPVIAKVDWSEQEDRRTGEKRKNHRLDFLVYLASLTDKKTMEPWGPAIISAHGWAASGIEDAFKDWDKDSRDARAKFAPGVDSLFFYNIVGTFGDARVTRPAGEKRVVVVCQYSKPTSGWNEEYLSKLFVGENIAAVIVDLQIQAKEWSEDTWENRLKSGKSTGAAPQESVRFGGLQPEDNVNDEIPF